MKYVHKDDKTKVLSQKEWKKLSEDTRRDYVRTEMERREKECVSYARVWGEDKYAVGRTYYQMHTDYYNEVGRKYGLARGENIAMLPDEERRNRVHKNKAVLEAERQSKEAVAKSKAENEQLHQQKSQLEGEMQQTQQKKAELDGKVSQLMDYADKLDIKNEALNVPSLKTSKIVTDAINAINGELGITIPAFKQKEWREQRKLAIKNILTNMQNDIFNAQELKEKEILELGRSIYKSAIKKTAELIKQNQQLHKENERVKAENSKIKSENDSLKAKISTMDDKAINALRKQKNGEISELQGKLNEANRSFSYYNNKANRESQRADKAESFLSEVFAVPEIKQIWDTHQQNIAAFWQQMDKWICDALTAIMDYARARLSIFTPEHEYTIAHGIIAEAFKRGLDSTDEGQRKTAANHLLDRMEWRGSGVTESMCELAILRTQQLSDEMTVKPALVEALVLASGGRGLSSNGGGSSYITQLTNWDGTKKKGGGLGI